jgi:hypothetical protein
MRELAHWSHDTNRDNLTALVIRGVHSEGPGEFWGEAYDQAGAVVHKTGARSTYEAAAKLLDAWLASQPTTAD